MAEQLLGCPDWGPDGEERCYECDTPVDEKLHSCVKYEGPIAEAFAECFVCGAPRLDSVGESPKCRGLVFEFPDKYACFNELSGNCDFSLDKDHLDEMEIIPERITVGNLLISPENVVTYNHDRYECTHRREIAFTETQGWHIKITEVDQAAE